jgi:hypothetical protein
MANVEVRLPYTDPISTQNLVICNIHGQERPATAAGAVVTVLVWLAVAAYTTYTVITWLNRPWVTSTQNLWGYNNGPWPVTLRCRAPSGCWVSNKVDSR